MHIRQKQTHKLKYIENNVFLFPSFRYGHGGCTATWMSVFDCSGEHRTEIIRLAFTLGSRRIQGIGCTLLFDDLFFLTWLPPPVFFLFFFLLCNFVI